MDELPLKGGGTTLIVSAEVAILLLSENGTTTFESGVQFGGSRVVSGNLPDAKKGAVTDAIGKALAVLGIGNKAYRGALQSFKGKVDKLPTVDEDSLPDTSGMSSSRFTPKATAAFKPANGNGAAKAIVPAVLPTTQNTLPATQVEITPTPAAVETPTETDVVATPKTKPRYTFKDSKFSSALENA